MTPSTLRARLLAASTVALAASPALAQRVVTFGDEYLLSDAAFTNNNADASQLAAQLANFIGYNQANRNFLVLSFEPELTGASLGNAMTGFGHSWTVNGNAPVTLASLQAYDGVFFCGLPGSGVANAAVLAQYVNGGGSVVVMGGSGSPGGPASEAAAWNPFLNTFGLQLNMPLIGPVGQTQISLLATTNPVGVALNSVWWGYGHSVSETNVLNPQTDVIFGSFVGTDGTPAAEGVIGTYDGRIPAPGSLAVLGLAGVVAVRRRR